MNKMDKQVAADPTKTDKQKLEHKFGNAFQPLSVAIEGICDAMLDEDNQSLSAATYYYPNNLAAARDTYLAEMREFFSAMDDAKPLITPEELAGIVGGLLELVRQGKGGLMSDDERGQWYASHEYVMEQLRELHPLGE